MERVFVHDRKVMGVVLYSSYGIVIDYKEKTSAEIADAVQEALVNDGLTCNLGTYQIGSDGLRTRAGLVLLLACDELFTRTIIGIVAQRIA